MTRSIYRTWLQVGCALFLGILRLDNSSAQDIPPRKYAVQISAVVQEAPPRILLRWPDEGDANRYRISRRALNGDWQELATLGGAEISFPDSHVTPGKTYEYQIVKETSGKYTGYGYIRAGIRAPMVEQRGKLILLVETSIAGAIEAELQQLELDLTGDGWEVIRRSVLTADSPQSVKELIKAIFESDPGNVKALFLLGHIPVPYSGNFFPDGHENHQGAWPADVYYADVDGEWTDSTVDNSRAERQANRNVPGDGKLDQSRIPSAVELMTGRVDLSNLTCYANKTNARSEIDLTRQYLHKNHAFRMGEVTVEKRGLICDNFSDKGSDPISGSAWRNFAPFFGTNSITEVGWDGYLPEATENSYLWSYGSGGGSYYYSTGVATSDDFALRDLKVVFTMFMGSYFGDWNNESNFLRAALGSGYILTTSYSGFPQSLYFPMALGETIGFATMLTQNNPPQGLFPPWNKGAAQVHIALLGDPTLRLDAFRPPSSLNATSGPSIALNWTAAPDDIVGYHLFRATSEKGPFTRVTLAPIRQNSFQDCPPSGTYYYMVRAVKLEQSGSGTYLNLSQGIFATADSSGSSGPASKPLALSLNYSTGRAALQVGGESGQKFQVYTSSDLLNWSELGSNTLNSGSVEFPITIDETQSCTFFRVANTE